MKKAILGFAMFVFGTEQFVSGVTMEECIAQIPADSTEVCEYANTNGEVCWMRNDLTTGDLIFQCETKQWTALSCGSRLVSTCPQYDQAGQCLFVNCSGMTCKLTSPGRYGSKHLSCDRSNFDSEVSPVTTTTTTAAPSQDNNDNNRGPQNINQNILQPSCESLIWGETREACRASINSNNFGKCQYVVLPSSVVNNNELTICVWQCCGDEDFAQCTTGCETRLLYDGSSVGEEEEMTRRDMSNDSQPEEESVAPSRDHSQWGLSRGEERAPEKVLMVDGFAADGHRRKSQQKELESLAAVATVPFEEADTLSNSYTDIAISAPQSAESQPRRQQ